MHLAHTLAIAWSCLIFLAATFVLPAAVTLRQGTLLGRVTRGGLNAAGFWVGTTLCLSGLKCFNALMLLLVGFVTLGLARKQALGLSFRTLRDTLPDHLLATFPTFERVSAWVVDHLPTPSALKRSAWIKRQGQILATVSGTSFAFLGTVAVVIAFVISAHISHVQGLRLHQPDEYLALLRTRELILSANVFSRPFFFPSLAATNAVLSAVDPLPAVQALCALQPVLLSLALGRVAFLLTRSLLASAVAMYCQGVASVLHALAPAAALCFGAESGLAQAMSTPPPNSLEIQGALMILLLWMAVLTEARSSGVSGGLMAPTVACAIGLAASCPVFLLLLPFVGAACLSRRPKLLITLGLSVLTIGCIGWMAYTPLPALDPQGVACVVCLLLGLLTYGAEVILVALAGLPVRILLGAAWVFVAVTWLPPQATAEQPLEYESVARNATAIAEQFPHQRWIIAAPVEQLAEVYSLGSFEDLASLVNKAQGDDLATAFRFGSSYDNLFIFVEKNPFSPFNAEPDTVEFPVLADSTYRYYRSPAGRASLEARAIHLCETYRATHHDITIFYEDESIRIYRVRLSSARK